MIEVRNGNVVIDGKEAAPSPETLAALIEAAGVTRERAARILGLSRSSIQKKIAGQVPVRRGEILALAAVAAEGEYEIKEIGNGWEIKYVLDGETRRVFAHPAGVEEARAATAVAEAQGARVALDVPPHRVWKISSEDGTWYLVPDAVDAVLVEGQTLVSLDDKDVWYQAVCEIKED